MNLVSIPHGLPFLESLARELIASPTRADDIVLLPTHRAGRALAEAFAEAAGGETLLLPRILSLGELDPDAIAIQAEAELELADDPELRPAIAPLRRRLLLARLIARRDPGIPPGRALQLAAALARLIDEVQFNRLDFDGLDELVAAEFAEHWQQTLDFLAIVTEAWPAILAEEGRLDPIDRRNRLYAAQIALWRARPPAGRVVAAGSTGIMPATADLLASVAAMPNGLVVLPGLDRHLDKASWGALEQGHPQWALARLLDRLELAREDVPDWPGAGPPAPRARLVAEAMRPAETTEAWRDLAPEIAQGAEGLTLARFAGPAAEAGAIALMLREAVEEKRSAALVTPDRDLARRVAVELGRWGLTAEDSAGETLDRTPPGAFLRLVAHVAAEGFAPAPLLAALKHPLAACGMAPPDFRRAVRRLERRLLRGPRPGNGLEGLLDAAEEAADERALETAKRIARAFEPLGKLHEAAHAPLAALLAAHVEAAERLAHTGEDGPGGARLWRGEAGEAAAATVAEFDAAAAGHPPIAPDDYAALFDEAIAGQAVRAVRPRHPGLAILGPLEARLQRADRLVLAGLNQGAWPPEPAPDPWMSRQMRIDFGLPPAETRQGLAAHDFAQALGAGEVILTRSERLGADPTVPSPWLQRLETVLTALDRPIEDRRWAAWQAELDRPAKVQPVAPPRPRPPVAARPRRMSVTGVQTWLEDPYTIFARDILKLRPLDPIDALPAARDFGIAVHRALQRFVELYPGPDLPADAEDVLRKLGRESLEELPEEPLTRLFWTERFDRAAESVIAIERARRHAIERILTEIEGRLPFDCPAGRFMLTAKADRIERGREGGLAIVDYKSGAAPSGADVAKRTARQLPLEALIAESGGFAGCPAAPTDRIEYWLTGGARSQKSVLRKIADREARPDARRAPYNLEQLLAETLTGLKAYAAAFDEADMPYLAEPRPGFAPHYNDYRHLSRKDEWLRTL